MMRDEIFIDGALSTHNGQTRDLSLGERTATTMATYALIHGILGNLERRILVATPGARSHRRLVLAAALST